jgi:hypothetical protein
LWQVSTRHLREQRPPIETQSKPQCLVSASNARPTDPQREQALATERIHRFSRFAAK